MKVVFQLSDQEIYALINGQLNPDNTIRLSTLFRRFAAQLNEKADELTDGKNDINVAEGTLLNIDSFVDVRK